MAKNLLGFFLSILCVGLLPSCSDSDSVDYVRAAEADLTKRFDRDGGTATVNIETNVVDFVARADDARWCRAEVVNGAVVITVDPQNTPRERESIVYVSAGNAPFLSIRVIQAEGIGVITPRETEFLIPASEEDYIIELGLNASVEPQFTLPAWITFVPDGETPTGEYDEWGGTYRFRVQPMTEGTEDTRTVEIGISAKTASDVTPSSVTVTQANISKLPARPSAALPATTLFDYRVRNNGGYDAATVDPANKLTFQMHNGGAMSYAVSSFYGMTYASMYSTLFFTNRFTSADYKGNDYFKNAFKTEHSIEVLYNVTQGLTNSSVRSTPISAQSDNGGFGIESSSSNIRYKLATSTDGGASTSWAPTVESPLVTNTSTYVHVVFTYNSATGEINGYIDGQLLDGYPVVATGEVQFPSDESLQWICLSGDPTSAKSIVKASTGLIGNILNAKIYDKALDATQVAELYQRTDDRTMINNFDLLYSNLTSVLPGIAGNNAASVYQKLMVDAAIARGWDLYTYIGTTQAEVDAFNAFVTELAATPQP